MGDTCAIETQGIPECGWLTAKRDQTRAARIGRIVQTAVEEGTPRLE